MLYHKLELIQTFQKKKEEEGICIFRLFIVLFDLMIFTSLNYLPFFLAMKSNFTG